MDQLDSHFYNPLHSTRGQVLLYAHYQQLYESKLTFAFQFDRNMARQFHSETVVAAANFQCDNVFL
jgi:hypothetical protein